VDINETAKRIVDQATNPEAPMKDPIAVELGRRGGLKGGRARAEKMTAQERSRAARHAAQMRWGSNVAQVERIGRHVPTKRRFPYGQYAAHRITIAGPCMVCAKRMERGEICTLTMNPRGPVCTECRPILCSIEQLALDRPPFPDPRAWSPLPWGSDIIDPPIS